MEKASPLTPASDTDIQSRILTIRGVQVMLDSDLALLYGVTTKRLNEQVKRNVARFPARFMFRLSHEDIESLRSQFATSINIIRHYSAFHASSVLQSSREYWCYTVCRGLYPY